MLYIGNLGIHSMFFYIQLGAPDILVLEKYKHIKYILNLFFKKYIYFYPYFLRRPSSEVAPFFDVPSNVYVLLPALKRKFVLFGA